MLGTLPAGDDHVEDDSSGLSGLYSVIPEGFGNLFCGMTRWGRRGFVRLKTSLFFLLVFVVLGMVYTPRVSALTGEEEINIKVYKEVSPSVVNITTTTLIRDLFSIYPRKGAGSGSIIDPSGYVLTNYHVIEGASEIMVTLIDGRKYPARFVGADSENDIAVIKINPEKRLAPVRLGDSDKLQVGQKVFAIGNPFGLNSTLTTGIISALGRPLTTEGGRVIESVIQTDAPINPGNSGGPLINTSGEMIGINTAIFTRSGGSIGIGFAIPVKTVKILIPDLIRYGRVRRAWLGIIGVPLWKELSLALRLPVEKGILVSEVDRSAPAARAGIRGGSTPVEISGTVIYVGGDIIISVDGRPVGSMEDIKRALRGKKEGQVVAVEVIRAGKRLTLKVPVRLKS
ncbi:periplasmic serine endoprotease DegP precursor [bacterium BMS3Bbin06]|nr:periplasmic serine endoprotease DegP precursor [bacterium BMS3Abin08]GBE35041.1 periplasmic serine endoprotease DegP precursor [bacterium BMS3Bbin06]HDO36026.1 trypsin-like serine protease [Nitrospirota bacterium]HDY71888.1 trypsin-like serine protease [Nitrospirota bacterium]